VTVLAWNTDFSIFTPLSIKDLTNSGVHGQHGTAGGGNLLRTFIALFFEMECVLSIALGD